MAQIPGRLSLDDNSHSKSRFACGCCLQAFSFLLAVKQRFGACASAKIGCGRTCFSLSPWHHASRKKLRWGSFKRSRVRSARPSKQLQAFCRGHMIEIKLNQVLPISDSPGLLLLNRFLRPLYANEEAVSILCFPKSSRRNKRLGHFLVHRIDSLVSKQDGSLSSKFSDEIASGKRRYQVRAFKLKPHLRNSLGATFAVLLERKPRASLDLLQIGQEFRLTQRETEALGLLMQGYTTRQIASRMDISPNTAKTFLRSIMFKTGACDRSGILAKVMQAFTLCKGLEPPQ